LDRQACNNSAAYLFLPQVGSILTNYGFQAGCHPPRQIGRRIKISGAQWNEQNVPQVLAHRVTYLNGMIGVNLKAAA
jgi:hypothetical protein